MKAAHPTELELLAKINAAEKAHQAAAAEGYPSGKPGDLNLVVCFWENGGCVDAVGASLNSRTWAEIDGLIREALAADAARVASVVLTAEARLACAWGL